MPDYILMQNNTQHPEIPTGDYCYCTAAESTKENGIHLCPHFVGKDVNGVRLPYCKLLKMGSVPASAGSLSDEEKEKLIEAWGLSPIGDDYVAEALKRVAQKPRKKPSTAHLRNPEGIRPLHALGSVQRMRHQHRTPRRNLS